MRPTEIIIHHSATKDSGTVSWNAIRRYHIKECCWGDIGYHFGIEFVEDKGDPRGSYEIMIGRMPDVQGAHTSGQNNKSLGICFVGNFDETAPPLEQWLQGVKLVRWLCVEFNITTQNIFPHNKFAVKTCPGTMFDMAQFRQNVQEGL